MRIIARKALRQFWGRHPDAEQPLRAWYHDAQRAHWKSPSDLKALYRNASLLINNRVVFNIKGNRYRLVAAIHYSAGIVFVLFIGSQRI